MRKRNLPTAKDMIASIHTDDSASSFVLREHFVLLPIANHRLLIFVSDMVNFCLKTLQFVPNS